MPKIRISNNLSISLDSIACLYRNLRKLIEQNLVQAKQNNKKILIMLGEDHASPHSLLIKNIVLHIAKELNITNFYPENSQKINKVSQMICAFELDIIENLLYRTKIVKKIYELIFGLQIDNETNESHFRTFRIASKLGLNILPIDDFDGHPNFDLRNRIMAKHLKKFNQDGVLVTGFSHVPGLVEDFELEKEYHILPINLCYLTPQERDAFKSSKKFGHMDFTIKEALRKNQFLHYTFYRAEKRSVEYLETNKAIQILFNGSDEYTILDYTGKTLNEEFQVDIREILNHIKRPTLISTLSEIPTNIKQGFSLITSLCKKSYALSSEEVTYFESMEKKSIDEFRTLQTDILCQTTSTHDLLGPRPIIFNQRKTLLSISEMSSIRKTNKLRDSPV